MRFDRTLFLGRTLIIFAAVTLFLVNGVAWGQCIPGSKAPTYGGHEGYWLSSGTGKVPFALWPPEMQRWQPNWDYANV
jgi:hypothetical protein